MADEYKSKYTGDQIDGLLDKINNFSYTKPQLCIFWSDADVSKTVTVTHVVSAQFPDADTVSFSTDNTLNKVIELSSFGDWLISLGTVQVLVTVQKLGITNVKI